MTGPHATASFCIFNGASDGQHEKILGGTLVIEEVEIEHDVQLTEYKFTRFKGLFLIKSDVAQLASIGWIWRGCVLKLKQASKIK